MKTTILLIAALLMTASVIAQPKSKQQVNRNADDSIVVKRREVKDTLPVRLITFDKEGYLQRQPGLYRAVRSWYVYAVQGAQPELRSVTYYDDKWQAVTGEIYQALPPEKK